MKSLGSSQGKKGVTGNTCIAALGGNGSHGLAYCSKEIVTRYSSRQELSTTVSVVNTTLLLARDIMG